MLDTAIQAAKEGGEVLKAHFQTALQQRLKEDASIVTEADEEAEKKILEVIQAKYPEHNFLGEEGGELEAGSEYSWVIDPLDGTRNFVNGIPIFAISIALLKGEEHVASVVYNPLTEELFSAEKGRGSFCNGHQFHVSEHDARSAMITIGTSSAKESKEMAAKVFSHALQYVGAVRYLGSAVLELSYLARGGTEGFINLGTKKWDYAAGTLLVLEAGGKITDFQGNPWDLSKNYFIASNSVIHPQLLELIQSIQHT
ncbi:MAG TPA: inositol monophosphatase family protein [Candidatus Paceibacterota bacterium]